MPTDPGHAEPAPGQPEPPAHPEAPADAPRPEADADALPADRRRADAVRNRARIVAAARDALAGAAPGEELRLNAVAKAAGVGQGTLYRHFATREELLAEVHRQDVAELVDEADTLLTAYSPVEALGRWFDRLTAYARVKRGVLAALEPRAWNALTARSHGTLTEAIERLLVLIAYLSRLEESEWPTRARHLLDVLLNGLRTRP
ncbi:TetR/AcrR family transcriptional regulator [Streptomyces sp. NEAU-H3]|uniref:TetR/AcrR family transcriptional regulator n=1 Tax=Streptomyces sp. NEAU-H3 TaxID=2720636 RepID=UPI00143A13DC|nr:TetR/AcrR family transcriptional regulator [Streptomyces sp. NEAU-H3]NJA60407.1 helix-turn-helix transcriptional regulator [Streptomyces sp. NEAU-H3]